MSSIYVPDELLESIFSFIHDKTSQPTPLSQRTFASLALTSKRFLALSRSHLYYRPIPPPSFASHVVTWRKALSLEAALSSPLGQLVVSLEGIVDFVSEVGTLKEPSSVPFQLRGCTEAFSLYRALLAACGKLEFVELIFDSTEHLARLSMALEGSTSTLKTVKFMNSRFSEAYHVTSSLVCSALRRDRFKKIDNLILTDITILPRVTLAPSTAISLKSLSISTLISFTHASYFRVFFPEDPSTLSSLSISVPSFTRADLVWILDYAPTTLEDLSLSTMDKVQKRAVAPSQYLTLNYPSIPFSNLSRCSSLTKISLNGFDGPSLPLLLTLASSAPRLEFLDFAQCKWISSSISAYLANDLRSIIKPDDLLMALLEFKKLRNVHLGILPVREEGTYQVLKQELVEKRGWQVQWQTY